MKMIKVVSAIAVGGALAGCATKEMKSTPFYEGDDVEYAGEASERVNLWPVAYWRNPVGAVAWPLVSFSDDHFALRPLYSQYKQDGKDGAWDEINVAWPLVQADTKHEDYRVFPVFWGEDRKGRDYQCVFPIYWNGADYNALFPLWYYGSTTNSWNFNITAGIAGAGRDEKGKRCSWTFPLWYEDSTGVFSTLVYGQTKDSYWVFPLWYKDQHSFYSPIFSLDRTETATTWSSLALLSCGKTSHTATGDLDECALLLGLGGWVNTADKERESGLWWAFPFVQRNWNVSAGAKDAPYAHTEVACYLAGWSTRGEKMKDLYVFPLFWWQDDGSWMTPLGGQWHSGGTTDTVITPIAGITSGKQTGSWLWPLWAHCKDADFDEKVALIDAPTLPDCVKVSVHTNDNEKSEYFGKTYLRGTSIHSASDTTVLLHHADRSVIGWSASWYDSATNKYEITECYKRGHDLLLGYWAKREVAFDLKTRAKLSDEEESEANFLLWLYQYEWSRNRMAKGGELSEYTRHRVLWRLWDWEEGDGDVSLDVFPGFTYDSRKDGYTKTSLLWRLFRYERDPKSGTSVDFLFVPVWR